MKLLNTISTCAALMLATYTVAMAEPIQTLPGLQSVTIYETTNVTTAITYAPSDTRLTTRLNNPLNDTNNKDFGFYSAENYDVFYSNSDGTFNADGAFLTIEGNWTGNQNYGGMNINEVKLTFEDNTVEDNTDNPVIFGDFVSSFAFGSVCSGTIGCVENSQYKAIDHNLATFPRMGVNPNLNERIRLTIGFHITSCK